MILTTDPWEPLLNRRHAAHRLTSLSLTGGEPIESLSTLHDYVLPLPQYAKGRGLQTQVNTNLTSQSLRAVA